MSNGYIAVDILGRRRGIKFGMIAVQQINEDAQKLGHRLGASVDLAMVPVIVYWGLYNNCYVKREDPDFSFEDVADFVDDNINTPEIFQEIVKCFYESKIVSGATSAADTSKDEKKNTTLKRGKVGKS